MYINLICILLIPQASVGERSSCFATHLEELNIRHVLLYAIHLSVLPYFFGYKTEFFSFQNNPKDLDPSYKTDLDLWDCLGRVKLVL